jgi:uncharacterized metal-binding protein
VAKSSEKILIIPCSGIGKAFGSISREAANIVTEKLRKDETGTVCLSLLVMGDEEAGEKVRNSKVITIDGCPTGCARKNVEASGGTPAVDLRVVDTYREHHEEKPVAITELDEAGKKLAQILAEEIAAKVDEIRGCAYAAGDNKE